MDGSSSIGRSTITTTSTEILHDGLNDNRISALRSAGYNDDQIETLLALANPDEEGGSLTSTHFYSANRAALNALASSKGGDASDVTYIQAPIALMQEMSNPSNWHGDSYIGPASETVNRYLTDEVLEPSSSKITLEALAFAVITARSDIIQRQLEQQIDAVTQKNDNLLKASAFIVQAESLKNVAPSNMPVDMWSFMRENIGNVHGRNPISATNWDLNIQSIKSYADSLTNQSQLDTSKIQQTIAKYNQSFDMLSNFTNKYFQSLTSAIQNLR